MRALHVNGAPSSDYDLNKAISLPPDRTLKPAAVLIGVEEGPQGPRVVLTKRASALKHHPGQIAFPGGKQDAGDQTLDHTALREAREEIGLPESHVDILGQLPAHETVTGFQVTPVLALVRPGFPETPEIGEVAEVFRVPLDHVLNPDNFLIEGRYWQGHMRRYYIVPYGPYYIWGATARMLRALADRMQGL
jgi:8-oxo-dGTP pyrophosphatase MutT (NUDIX family)